MIDFGAGMAPSVVHFGEVGMNQLYYEGGLHDLVERVLIDAFAILAGQPAPACGCRRPLDGSLHGQPPAWLTRRADSS